MNRHQFLAQLHKLTRPRTYLEIGIQNGHSIALTRVPSIGIDPEFSIEAEIQADVHLARTTSDEFFTRAHPLAHLPEPVVDLAFIDGMHLSEYVVRDYLAVERFTIPSSVVVFDDMLPRSVDEAARRRHTQFWTGDVYKALEALRQFRPDLTVIEVATEGTGTARGALPGRPARRRHARVRRVAGLRDAGRPAGRAARGDVARPRRGPGVAAVLPGLDPARRACGAATRRRWRPRPRRGRPSPS